MTDDPYRPPQSAKSIDALHRFSKVPIDDGRGPEGLGGWLILVGFGLVMNPIQFIGIVFNTYLDVFRSGAWQRLTDPASPLYHALWGPTIVFETVGHALFLAMSIASICLFFLRSRWFPRAFIAMSLSNVVFLAVDLALMSSIPAVTTEERTAVMYKLPRVLFWTMIWSIYMLRSRRVKNTFR